jgi:membrane fusion protein (multidrug efflux system)
MDAKTPRDLREDPGPRDERQLERPRKDEHDADEERRRRSEKSKDEQNEDDEPQESWPHYLRRHKWWVVGAVVVAAILLIGILLWWLHARQYESTDDAFVDTRIMTISAQVSGAIGTVAVTDNQLVESGAVLMTIDDQLFQAQLAQARAQVDQAQANIANLDAQIDQQQARIQQADQQIEQAQAMLVFAKQDFARYQKLAETAAAPLQQAQQAQSTLLQNEANFVGAQANAVATRKQLKVLTTQRDGAAAQLEYFRAQLQNAQTSLGYTVLTAPVAGRITKLTAAKGTYTTPGQALTMFVPREVWVTANFKETQLTLMRPNQPVDLRIDAFPDRTFRGHVDSFQAGSGTVFSLLPAENATGNYVKVVQRVPVKIVFDDPPDVHLGPGMSVVPTVKVR